MQKKQELMSQLDFALKRKVQEKYLKQTRTQDFDPLQREFYGVQADKHNAASKLQHKTPISTTSIASKSPIAIHQKHPAQQIKSQNHIQMKSSHSPNIVKSPKLQTDREIGNNQHSSIHFATSMEESQPQLKAMDEIKRLKSKNMLLEKELREFKLNIAQLQNESKSLKRDEGQYLKLKQQNLNLVKQIQFFRSKSNDNRVRKDPSDINLPLLEEEIKKALFQLNISSLFKQSNSEKFLFESLKHINQAIVKMCEEKARLTTKLNNFDIQTLLVKENNTAYRKQLEVLRNENEQLQVLIQQNCVKIEELEQANEAEFSQKKKLEVKCKDISKQLDAFKKQFKLMVDASKHSKPKREYCVSRSNKESIAESFVKTYADQQSQTECQVQLMQSSKISSVNNALQTAKQHESQLQQKIEQLTQKIEMLTQYISELQSNNLNQDIQKSKLLQKNYKYEQCIKQLQYKSEEIKKDLSNFMPQLKEMQQENNRLKYESSYKDQQIINKISMINQIRNNLEEIEEKLSIGQLQLNKQVFQNQLAKQEIDKLNNAVSYLTSKSNELENALQIQENEFSNSIMIHNSGKTQRQTELANKARQLQKIVNQKTNQIANLTNEWSRKEKQLLLSISKVQSVQKMSEPYSKNLASLSQRFQRARQQIEQKITDLHKQDDNNQRILLTYQKMFKETEQNCKLYEQTFSNLQEQYGKLENSYNFLNQSKLKLQNVNLVLTLKNDQLSRQIFVYKCDIQRLGFDSKNNGQLKQYYQQISDELKSKLEQLLQRIANGQNQKTELMQRQVVFEKDIYQKEITQTQMLHSLEQKDQECENLKGELHRLSEEYHFLSQECIRIKNDAQFHDRQRIQQITMQNYDIQRLVRESNQMRYRIQQATFLKQSRNFQQSESEQRMLLLAQQNRSLVRKNEILLEELHMKQTNKEQDQYLNELKNKQYCILLKKLLTDLVDNQVLQHCDNFQELLEIGSEKAVKKKMRIRDQESEMRKQTVKSSYEMEYAAEPTKRYYIGTEISSSEELMGVRNFGSDEILQMQSKIIDKPGEYVPDSPRSFKFCLSPYEQEKKQKRTERFISCFNNSAENQSKLLENRDTFKY